MTTSTPPAWNWLSECAEPLLPARTPKLPVADAFRERNDSNPDPTYQDCWPSERYPSDECDCTAQMTESAINAVPEHPAWICNDCGEAVYGKLSGVSTWHEDTCGICGETKAVTEPRDFGGYQGLAADNPFPDALYDLMEEAANRQDGNHGPSACTRCGLSPCECDGDTEIPDRMSDRKLSVEELSLQKPAEMADRIPDTFHIPFKTQEFLFEELCEEKLAELPHLIFTHSERIIEMARDRFRKGYAKFGSEMYSWSPERRLDETLQELADAVVYPTSGPIE